MGKATPSPLFFCHFVGDTDILFCVSYFVFNIPFILTLSERYVDTIFHTYGASENIENRMLIGVSGYLFSGAFPIRFRGFD